MEQLTVPVVLYMRSTALLFRKFLSIFLCICAGYFILDYILCYVRNSKHSTVWRCMHRTSYCNVYISRPTRCTNYFNEFLLIISLSTYLYFGLLCPSSGAKFFKAVYRNVISRYFWLLDGTGSSSSCNYLTARRSGLYQLHYSFKKCHSWRRTQVWSM